jgi:hypothetical protein
MSFIDIICKNSVSFSNNCFHHNNNVLVLGQCSQCLENIYLFFDLPPDLYIRQIKNSRLILYKLPVCIPNKTCSPYTGNSYCLYPLTDFYNIYSYHFSGPHINYDYKTCFIDDIQSSYTEIDITQITQNWHDEKLENKGLIITSPPNSLPIFYAGHNFKILAMRPMLRITYENLPGPPIMNQVPCTVEISQHF